MVVLKGVPCLTDQVMVLQLTPRWFRIELFVVKTVKSLWIFIILIGYYKIF